MTPEPFLLNPKNLDFVEGRGRKARSGSGCLMAFAILFLLFAIPSFGFVGREWYIASKLRLEGVETQATVTQLQSNSDSDSTTYSISYRFEASGADGMASHNQSHQIALAEYCRLTVGGPVKIVYARSDPSLSRTAAAPWQRFWPLLGMSAFVLVWSAFPAGLLVWAMRSTRKERERLRLGTTVPGQIIFVKRSSDSDGDESITVDYVFTAPDGRGHRASASATRNDLKGQPLPGIGTPLRILFASEENFELL